MANHFCPSFTTFCNYISDVEIPNGVYLRYFDTVPKLIRFDFVLVQFRGVIKHFGCNLETGCILR